MTCASDETETPDGRRLFGRSPDKRAALCGTRSTALQRDIVIKALRAIAPLSQQAEDARRENIEVVLAMLEDIAPRSALEGVLAAQMVATNNAAMESLRRASLPGQSKELREMELKNADRFLKTWLQQYAALDKHRGKGGQHITVNYVAGESARPAIAGEVHPANDTQQDRRAAKPAALVDETRAKRDPVVPRVRMRRPPEASRSKRDLP